jgi:hypothetical protein
MHDNEPGVPGRSRRHFEERDEVPHVLKIVHGMLNLENHIAQH